MRILVLTSSYPTSAETVASSFLQDWVDALCARGHDLTVLAPCDRQHSTYVERAGRRTVRYFQYLPRPRWQTLAYGAGMYDNAKNHPLRMVQLPPFLLEQYRQGREFARDADVLHAHWLFPAGLVGAAVKRETGIPLVISIHSTDFHLLRLIPAGRLLARAIVSVADRLHFVTEYHRRRFVEWLGTRSAPERSYVAPMGVSDALIDRAAAPFRREPRIGFLGRLIHLKGVDRLLRACVRVGRREVEIAGSGPAYGGLVKQAHQLGIDARFIGPVSGAAKVKHLDSCDVLVFPSRHYASGRGEGLPVSLIEALARGRVVIASDSGGIPEIVRHRQNGYLFPARSDSALADVLGEVLGSWPQAKNVAPGAMMTGRRLLASALAAHHESAYRLLCPQTEKQEEPA